jgi:hypothetical protein
VQSGLVPILALQSPQIRILASPNFLLISLSIQAKLSTSRLFVYEDIAGGSIQHIYIGFFEIQRAVYLSKKDNFNF